MMWEGVAAISGIILALCAIAGFLIQGNKEAEARGRLLQRVDTLEADADKLSSRVSCVEDGHADTNTQLATVNATMKAMDDKLNAITTMLERRELPRG